MGGPTPPPGLEPGRRGSSSPHWEESLCDCKARAGDLREGKRSEQAHPPPQPGRAPECPEAQSDPRCCQGRVSLEVKGGRSPQSACQGASRWRWFPRTEKKCLQQT